MTDKKMLCETLYKEYLELEKKTHIKVELYTPGKDLTPQSINPDDLIKKEELRKKLLDCKDCLNLKDADWFEIENG